MCSATEQILENASDSSTYHGTVQKDIAKNQKYEGESKSSLKSAEETIKVTC